MKKLMLVLGLLLCAPVLAHAEGKFIVNGVNKGQFTDLAITGAYTTTTKTGLKATIDMSTIGNTNATSSTTPAGSFYQANATGPLFGAICQSGALNTCGSYTTTTSSKVGSIAMTVNGATVYLRTYNGPQ